jgi:alkaline phosphatase D
MLGTAQEEWLRRALGASTTRWNLLGQQTVLAHFDQSGDRPRAYWADNWNGYPAARQRLIAALQARPAANPVVLGGDIHAFLVNDVHAVALDNDSPIVATELVTSSISSQAQAQATFDRWKAENPNVHLARADYRGYLRVAVEPARLHADLVAVDDVERSDSPTHVLASFDVENGKPGVAR